MTKPYINNAVIGNSRMLGCITDRGELIRLFWPNIDYSQHIDRMEAGVFCSSHNNNTLWFGRDNFHHSQYYIKDTNILKTVCVDNQAGIRVSHTDFMLPHADVAVREYEIENLSREENEIGFVLYSSFISCDSELRSSLFDFENDAVIHYKPGSYAGICSDREVWQFQLGNNAYQGAGSAGGLGGYDSIAMTGEGAMSWRLGVFREGERKSIRIFICASETIKGVKKLIRHVRRMDIACERENTERYWLNLVESSRQIKTGVPEIDALYRRSILVFKLMADEKSGGLLAAPEIDEQFTRCGRYAYCWGRDAAFITGALDKCGLTADVDRFYKWAVEVQDENGAWQQRHHMDGNLAPSWGLQIDETGTLVWGMLKHYEATGNKQFLKEMWESVEKAADFLLEFTDKESGLPRPSYDLWEERFGEHTYSSAAVCAGIKAAAEIARILGLDDKKAELWETAYSSMKEAMETALWKEDMGRFLRSIRTKLNPWGWEHSPNTVSMRVNPKEYYRDLTLEDPAIDVSLLGVAVPFEVFDALDPKVASTVKAIEEALTSPGVGGIRRYEGDNYIGGNPWILTTLWVALYYCRIKDFSKAASYLKWAVGGRTELDMLPEQVNKDSGKPEWVIPLTWSHAMFVLVLIELADEGALHTLRL
ncbi:oligosaccharide amylase [Anaerobacterium chartisolvens]|uniref:Oligosaccharide amylase n=1 Tax=Anaerobacterium chartisolvens TaxID=1297424 RepID=A0A369ALK8_9FIRM|nr:glycoside hydrolase family 15 protein [Anaerobacterium chartisolvens]RCX09975.1 oligosaccharide amylase [Anaerobacterium chartisolvens]